MEKKHILMVDDVTTSLKCASEVLKDTYKLSLAKSGKQALQFLERAKPDLILMDINMPDMDGYETVKIIKAEPKYADIPVVFLTADSETESEIEGFNLGAMDFIRKPFEPDVMLRRIHNIFQIEDTKKELAISANKDVLTGLWNRKYLEDQINSMGEEATAGAFLLFDMDNFKLINDHYGHIMGDEVLRKFAGVLAQYEGTSNLAARLGGDEFCLFLVEETEYSRLQEKAENLMQEIERNVDLFAGTEAAISVSVGAVLMPQDGIDFMTLYNKADKALYHVKQNGKHGYHIYQEKTEYAFNNEGVTNVDLIQLQKMFSENDVNGAFDVEYEGFRRIYQFVERCVERSDREVQIVLFTLENKDPEQLPDMIRLLNAAIVNTLRKGDVATKYSNTQYIVILMDSTVENGKKAADRVIEKYPYPIKYDIQTIKKITE